MENHSYHSNRLSALIVATSYQGTNGLLTMPVLATSHECYTFSSPPLTISEKTELSSLASYFPNIRQRPFNRELTIPENGCQGVRSDRHQD